MSKVKSKKKEKERSDPRTAIQRGRTPDTTVQVWGLPPEVKRNFKLACVAKRLTMTEVVESLLRGFISGRIEVTVDRTGRPRPGRTPLKTRPAPASPFIGPGYGEDEGED